MNKQQLQWKLIRLVRQVERRWDSFMNLWRGTQVTTRMCPNCRALVDLKARICPLCEQRLRYRPSGLGKLLQNLVPNYAPLSYLLLGINFILFLLIFISERDLSPQDLGRLIWGFNSRVLALWGADLGILVSQGQWWRLVSALFIHIGIIHLLFNCYALIFIGPLLEEQLGRERFLVVYLATGVFGFLLSNWYYGPTLTTAGASGAIFGLIGAALVMSKKWLAWGSVMHQQLIHWTIYGFGYGLFIGANNAAHIGGFIAGAAIAFLLPNPNRVDPSRMETLFWQFLFRVSIIVVGVSLLCAVWFRLSFG